MSQPIRPASARLVPLALLALIAACATAVRFSPSDILNLQKDAGEAQLARAGYRVVHHRTVLYREEWWWHDGRKACVRIDEVNSRIQKSEYVNRVECESHL